MTSSRLTLLALGIAMGAMLGMGAAPADAHTCSSSCNQIRRACRASARAIHKIAWLDCSTERDACRAACEADPLICPDGECEACKDDCDLVRVDCRVAAKDVRIAAQVTCDVVRTSCNDICQDPIDGVCVREAKADAHHGCVRPARLDYRQCMQKCPTGTGRQACVNYCRREMNADLDFCFDLEMLDVAQCIGVSIDAPPPTP